MTSDPSNSPDSRPPSLLLRLARGITSFFAAHVLVDERKLVVAAGRLPTRFWLIFSVIPLSIIVVAMVFLLAGVPGIPGFRFNETKSAPLGLWFVLPYKVGSTLPARGTYVEVCLPENLERFGRTRGYLDRGACPGDAAPVLKHLVALPGDVVDLRVDGMRINTAQWPRSARRDRDSLGRPLHDVTPLGTRHVPRGSVWLLGDSSRSWDSRYYGAVSLDSIIAFAYPLWTSPAAP